MKRVGFIVQILVLSFLINQSTATAQMFGSKQDLKMLRVLQLVSNQYVEEVDQEVIVESAIKNMLTELDPHSVYISADEVKEMNEPLQGNFEGIGIQFNILRDTIMVVAPIPGGPSEKVGIMAGDRIIKIDGEIVAGNGIKNKGVFTKLRGDKGTKVDVSIKRKSSDILLDFTITRDKIPIYSLDASYMLNYNTGYIKLNRFAKTTVTEFRKALADLKLQGLENLVLDLGGNGGGLLDQAVMLADEFLVEDQLIVYTEGYHSYKREYSASEYGGFEKGKLIVLIDEGSASASEILSGAVQDWDRGVIVGRRSFGKGLVQNQFLLPDGAMIRLTVSRYHTPTDRMIQKPYENGTEEYHKEIIERYENGELSDLSKTDFPDSLKYTTLVKGRTVFGGGGITPDVFVPIDTTQYSEYYGSLVRKGIVNQFVLDYVDANRDKLKTKYTDIDKFDDDFNFSEKEIKDLIKRGEKEGIEFNEEQFETSKMLLTKISKGLVARDIFGAGAYFQIVNTEDKAIQKALEVLDNWKEYLVSEK